ncbi:MAG TPA: non-ribosomal peptide synthetase [Mycobacteriales bacterium]
MSTPDSIPARFAAVARRYADRPAVLGDDRSLTYAQLAAEAARVTAAVAALPSPGGSDRGRVGVLLEHGVDTIVAILGVLAAGRAYVPLDPAYPADRLALMAADAALDATITTGAHAALATGRVLDLADLPGGRSPVDGPGPDDPAYVLYTSGSTGRPKGVVQAHRGVLFQAAAHARAHGIGPADRLGVVTSFGFDASVTDLFTALTTGAAAVPVDVRRHGLGQLAAALTGRGVTVYHSPPTLFRFLVGTLAPHEVLDPVRVVLLGGEEVTRRDVEAVRRHCKPGTVLVNGYGATEISFALQDRRTADDPLDGEVVPIGRPLDGLEVLLLAEGRPADLGEIVVRGRAVALGYRDRPAEQAERFTDLGGGVREYRTGDLGRRLPDGRIAYAGRRDRQVKVRGYRVELGEVEAALAALPGVAQATAVARTERAGETAEVLGYVVPAAGAVPDPAQLRRSVAAVLPHFAVPRAVVVLDALPLTPTGKVDALALPAPAGPASAGPASAGPAPAARGSDVDDAVQREVAEAWCAVLGVPAVGPDDGFFDLGGHSLLLATVQRRLEQRLGRPVPLHRMFEHPTVRSLSRWLSGESTVDDRVGERMRLRREARARRAR